MARYYGDFRSLNTSVDPLGQRYRVLIFTRYDNSNPYKYQEIIEGDYFCGRVPVGNYSITMTDHPFIVTYEGEENNIFKPYRCSTASISFMQSAFNTNFLNPNGTSVLVMLLKFNNDVVESGSRMVNTVSGAYIHKRTVYSHDHSMTYYNDYYPEEYDRFCFNVEWIGFSTPETYSMPYDSVNNVFTLNAQDGLSMLQYKDYDGDMNNSLECFIQPLLRVIGGLGVYKKIYLTDTVRFPGLQIKNGINEVYYQTRNFWDESKQPSKYLEVLESILRYLNLTAIPYKDTLIITSPLAIREGFSNYNVYALPQTNDLITYAGGTFEVALDEQLEDIYQIEETSYTSGGMQIGSTNVYNSVVNDINEYTVDLFNCDINNDENLRDNTYVLSTWTHGTYPEPQYAQYWEHNNYFSNVPELTTYQLDYFNGYTPLNDIDLTRNLTYYPTCWIIDDGGVSNGTRQDCLNKNYNPTRRIYFTQGWNANGISGTDNGPLQTLFRLKSYPFLISQQQYLFIEGEWRFYLSRTTPDNISSGSDPCDINYCHVRAKVKCANFWLANDGTDNNGRDKYKWVTTEQTVKLFTEYAEDKQSFMDAFKFRSNDRNFNSIVIPLPFADGQVYFGEIEIQFGRPVGCGHALAQSASLTGFKFEIHSQDYVNSRGKTEKMKEGSNTEFKTEMLEGSINKMELPQLNLSSLYEKGIRYSQVSHNNNVMDDIYNAGSGVSTLPEAQITNNFANQYLQPSLILKAKLRNVLTPYTLVTWSYLNGKNFIVNGTEIDYEYETAGVTLCEVRTASGHTSTVSNFTRNYRRNGDLNFNESSVEYFDTEILTYNPPVENPRMFIDDVWHIYTSNPLEGCITFYPSYITGSMLCSFPEEVEGSVSTNANGDMLLTLPDPVITPM